MSNKQREVASLYIVTADGDGVGGSGIHRDEQSAIVQAIKNTGYGNAPYADSIATVEIRMPPALAEQILAGLAAGSVNVDIWCPDEDATEEAIGQVEAETARSETAQAMAAAVEIAKHDNRLYLYTRTGDLEPRLGFTCESCGEIQDLEICARRTVILSGPLANRPARLVPAMHCTKCFEKFTKEYEKYL